MAKYIITETQHKLLSELNAIQNMMKKLKTYVKDVGKSPYTQLNQKLGKLQT
jgi:ribosomal protein S15P/S13E